MKLSLRQPAIFLLLLSLFAFGGCAGYQLGPIKPTELADIQTIAVPTVKNDTLQQRVQTLTTNAIIKAIQKDGSYAIQRESKSDAVLHVTITDSNRRQLRSSRTDVLKTSELEVSVTLDYSLINSSTGVEVAKGSVVGKSNVFLDPNFQTSERQAFQDAMSEASTQLVSTLSEGW